MESRTSSTTNVIKQLQSQNIKSLKDCKNSRDIDELMAAQTIWLENNLDTCDIYQLAKEKNEFALRAITQNIFDHPSRREKNKELCNKFNSAATKLAQEGYELAVNLLVSCTLPFIDISAVAYGYGLHWKRGWYGNIQRIENLLDRMRRPPSSSQEELNEVANAWAKGFFEENKDVLSTKEDYQNLLETILEITPSRLLFDKVSEKFNEFTASVNTTSHGVETKLRI